jgi:hypothetical protein
MAQQTAVEWLVEMITDMIHESHHSELADLFESAKEMEKEQIMNAFDIRKIDIAFDKKTTSEYYYTENYGTRLQNETN